MLCLSHLQKITAQSRHHADVSYEATDALTRPPTERVSQLAHRELYDAKFDSFVCHIMEHCTAWKRTVSFEASQLSMNRRESAAENVSAVLTKAGMTGIICCRAFNEDIPRTCSPSMAAADYQLGLSFHGDQ